MSASASVVPVNPCISCGACCAYYRASFYWSECDDATPGGVPVVLTEKMNDFRCMMRGTTGSQPRCAALIGTVGETVRCAIYEKRASVCRDFPASWENGTTNPRCDKARAAWSLLPLMLPEEQDTDTTTPPRHLPRAA